jgi:hypothetical protein
MTTSHAPGWREVLLLASAIVVLVLGAAIVTSLLPTDLQRIVFHSPLAILVLIGGTGLVLWRVASGGRPPRS